MRNLLVAVAIGVASTATATAPAPVQAATAWISSPNPATKAVDAFHHAISTGDQSGVLATLDDDAVIYEQGGVERTKAEYAASHLLADIAFAKGATETITARRSLVESDAACVITDGRMRGTYDGKPVDRAITETMMLRRRPAGWRIVHIHWSSGK